STRMNGESRQPAYGLVSRWTSKEKLSSLCHWLCLLLLFWLDIAGLAAAQPATGSVLLLSDIHFDSLADKNIIPDLASQDVSRWERIITSSKSFKKGAYPRRGKDDANYALFHSALLAAAHEEPFDFVIVLGDYLRHDFVNEFIKKGGPQSEL